jgi:hypothetical protein
MQFVRGAAEMEFLGDGYEVAQVSKLHLIRKEYQEYFNNILDVARRRGQTREARMSKNIPEEAWQTTGAAN